MILDVCLEIMYTEGTYTLLFSLQQLLILFFYYMSTGADKLGIVTMFHGIPASGGMGGGKLKEFE